MCSLVITVVIAIIFLAPLARAFTITIQGYLYRTFVPMHIIVDRPQRLAKMRSHTATHLLHASLQHFFPDTKQAGSLVDSDYLRFDYHADRMLTDTEISQIESSLNTTISQGLAVTTLELPLAQAKTLGAKMFFGDKYGEIVRVVTIGEALSVELCGGTHVTDTSHIGIFKIINQTAVASGTKRLIGLTGPKVMEYLLEQQTIIDTIATTLGCTLPQVVEKTTKLQSDFSSLTQTNQRLLSKVIDGYPSRTITLGDVAVQVLHIDASWSSKDVVDKLRSKPGEWLVIAPDGSYALTSSSSQAKSLATAAGWKGGGNDTLRQGKDPQLLVI